MEKKFNIKITDNETGKVIQEADTCCIIGGYVNDEGAAGMCVVHCNSIDYAKALNAAETAINTAYKNQPELKLLTLLTSAHCTTEEKHIK